MKHKVTFFKKFLTQIGVHNSELLFLEMQKENLKLFKIFLPISIIQVNHNRINQKVKGNKNLFEKNPTKFSNQPSSVIYRTFS